jgi:hypothetical protein
VRRRESIALLGDAANLCTVAAFVFASGLAASAWHAHEAGGQEQHFAPVLVLPVLSFQLAFYQNAIRRSGLGV